MQNQKRTFTSSTDETLTVALFVGKAAIKITVRHKKPGDRDRIGCKQFFELVGQDEEAEKAFDKLVKDAIAIGWIAVDRVERVPSFTAIPPAPGVKKSEVVGVGHVSTAPRAAAAGKR